jgi:hypothetical protein
MILCSNGLFRPFGWSDDAVGNWPPQHAVDVLSPGSLQKPSSHLKQPGCR